VAYESMMKVLRDVQEEDGAAEVLDDVEDNDDVEEVLDDVDDVPTPHDLVVLLHLLQQRIDFGR